MAFAIRDLPARSDPTPMRALRSLGLLAPLSFLLTVSCTSFWPGRGNYDKDLAMGREGSLEVAMTMGLAADPERVDYLRAVGRRLEAKLPSHPVPFTFHLVDSSELNPVNEPSQTVRVDNKVVNASAPTVPSSAIVDVRVKPCDI